MVIFENDADDIYDFAAGVKAIRTASLRSDTTIGQLNEYDRQDREQRIINHQGRIKMEMEQVNG